MAHFEVGKKVICIKRDKAGYVKSGDIYTVEMITRFPCKCRFTAIDIGLKAESCQAGYQFHCRSCNTYSEVNNDSTLLFSVSLFAPYDDSLSEISVEELIYTLEEQTA